MQTWIYSPLQRIASDSGWEGGRRVRREGGREGGKEAGGRAGRRDEQSAQRWAENRVKLKEQAWLRDHQARSLMKSHF